VRRIFAIPLFLAAFIIALALYLQIAERVPASIEKTEHGAHITLTVDDTSVLLDTDCVGVRWAVEQIQAVKLDGRGVVGAGEREGCERDISLLITFQDGSQQEYVISKYVLSESIFVRVLFLLVMLLVGTAVYISGLLPALSKHLRLQRVAAMVLRRFPSAVGRGNLTDSPLIWFTLTCILLIGMGLRSYYLSKPLRFDESWTYLDFASKPLSVGLVNYPVPNNHIFNTLLIHITTSIWGFAPWVMRLPAYWAGILLIAATYRLTRQFYGSYPGILAAGLVAASSHLIEYSVNARGYTLVALLFVCLLLLASALKNRPNTARWVLFALLGTIGLYTVPIMVYPLGTIVAWFLLSIVFDSGGRQRWLLARNMFLSLILMGILTCLLYLPVVIHMSAGVGGQIDLRQLEPTGLKKLITDYQRVFGEVWHLWNRDVPLWLGALLFLGLLISVVVHTKLSRYRVSLVVALLIWLSMVLFVQQVTTYERLWIFLLPAYLMLASVGITYLLWLVLRKWPSHAAAVFSVGTLGITLMIGANVLRSDSINYAGELDRAMDAEEVVLRLHDVVGTGDAIICAGPCRPHMLYGRLHHVQVFSVADRVNPDDSLYIIVVNPVQERDIEAILNYLHVNRDQFQATLLWDLTDSTVYRLDPVAQAAVSANH
jgi:hypothetical protein